MLGLLGFSRGALGITFWELRPMVRGNHGRSNGLEGIGVCRESYELVTLNPKPLTLNLVVRAWGSGFLVFRIQGLQSRVQGLEFRSL